MFLVEFPFAGVVAAGNFLRQFIQIIRGQFGLVVVLRAWQRMQFNHRVSILTFTAGLLDVFAFGFSLLANGFAICDLRTAHIGLHVVLAQHAVHNNLQVQLAHAGDQCLAGIRFGGNTESRIFLRQSLHGHGQLVLIGLGFWLDGHGNNRRWKLDGLQDHLLVFVAQRVASVDAFQSHARANVAGINLFNLFPLVGMHLQQAADPFSSALAGINHVAAGPQHAGVHPDVSHVPHKRVGHNFKCQRGKWLLIRSPAQLHFVRLRIAAFHRRNIHRRRQEVDYRV